MSNAFEVLGLSQDADLTQVRDAYRRSVKRCHPDQFQEKERQDEAQEQLIRLNLAYEEAIRLAGQKQVGFHTVSVEEAKRFAVNLMRQSRYENALRQLMRADTRDAEWFFLQGEVLMRLRQYASAHQSYREAVRRAPDNQMYRRGAFNAALTVRKHEQPLQRAADKLAGLFRRR